MEESLQGGNMTPGVVRVDDTVRRGRGPNADFSAQVLALLAEAGVSWAPRHLGVDDHGRDILSYMSGSTTDHPTQRDDDAYAQFGQILRELHTMTAGSILAGDQPCIIHGDPGPYNVITRAGLPVALIDWDTAGPGRPQADLGYAAWTWCLQSVGNVPIEEQARHLRQLRDGYDRSLDPEELLHEMGDAQDRVLRGERPRISDATLPQWRRAHARAACAWADQDHALLRANLDRFRGALT